MHPVLLGVLVGAIALVIGVVIGSMLSGRWLRYVEDLSRPLFSHVGAQTALWTLRRLRQGQHEEAIAVLEQRLDRELMDLVRHLQQHPHALDDPRFRETLGSIAAYRAEYPSRTPHSDHALEFEAEDGEPVRLRPGLDEALAFARKHGVGAENHVGESGTARNSAGR